jgi:hypothetical protein
MSAGPALRERKHYKQMIPQRSKQVKVAGVGREAAQYPEIVSSSFMIFCACRPETGTGWHQSLIT